MQIRPANESDFDAMLPIFRAVTAPGDTYAYAPDVPAEDLHADWFGPGVKTYVAEEEGRIVGMCKVLANRRDLGSHVANASFMVDPAAHDRGFGKAMGLHCLREAKRLGFVAMQFNFVVSTNEAAVALWKKLGFAIVGVLPKAFRHQKLGLVDAYVMHRFLDDIAD